MTFVFRTSSFFVVFVITIKATTFVVGNTSDCNGVAGRLNDHVGRLVDEAVRSRGEAREAADKVEDMAFALHALGDRVIECAGAVFAVIERAHAALRCIARSACVNISNATCTLHNLRSAMPKKPGKEVNHGGYIAAGQCG